MIEPEYFRITFYYRDYPNPTLYREDIFVHGHQYIAVVISDMLAKQGPTIVLDKVCVVPCNP